MTDLLWRLEATGPRPALTAAYDRLMADEATPALSLSLFERPDNGAMLEALFQAAPDVDSFLAAAGLSRVDLADVHAAPLPPQDWVALSLEGLPPVEAGRFFLHGGHDADKAPPGAIRILIEANQAFGTGHHGTTKGCLLAFDALLEAGETFRNVLDLGCGAGTLALAAAKTVTGQVMASDNDPLAIEVTLENLAANGAAGRVETVVAEGLADVRLLDRAPYDLIFANILAAPLIELAPAIAGVIDESGPVILSGLLAEQCDAVLAAYEGAGMALESEGEIEGWSTMVVRRN